MNFTLVNMDYSKYTINSENIGIYKYKPDYIEIKYSNIQNAGMGAFASQDIPKYTHLDCYEGIIINKRQDNNMYIYATIINNTECYIDGQDINKSNWTRFMNCSTKKNINGENVICIRLHNDMYVKNRNNDNVSLLGKICFFANRDIKKGEELLFNYGDEYAKILDS